MQSLHFYIGWGLEQDPWECSKLTGLTNGQKKTDTRLQIIGNNVKEKQISSGVWTGEKVGYG